MESSSSSRKNAEYKQRLLPFDGVEMDTPSKSGKSKSNHLLPKDTSLSLNYNERRVEKKDTVDHHHTVSLSDEDITSFNDTEDTVVDIYKRSSSRLRWLILCLTVLILLGPYYAYDNPAATQVALRTYFQVPQTINENSTTAQNTTFADFNVNYELLYSTYSLPNTVWPVMAGALVDKLGARAANIASTSISLVGHGIVATGIASQSWITAWAGRSIFGIGTELMCVSARMLVADWFLGGKGEVALAMGVLLATGRLSSVMNDAISGLFDGDQVAMAYFIGVAVCGVSVVSSIIAFLLDKRYTSRIDRQRQEEETDNHYPGINNYHHNKDNDDNNDTTTENNTKLSCNRIWKQVKQWRSSFWLLCILCVCGYCMVVSFNNVASAFLDARYKEAGENASTETIDAAMAILFLSAAIAATFAGSLVDYSGCRAGHMLTAASIVAVCHFVLAFTSNGSPLPEIMFAIMGSMFALFAAALWPAVAFVVPKAGLGLAYGIVGASQNIGLVITPLITSVLQPPGCDGSYTCVCLFFAGIAIMAIILSFILLLDEQKQRKGNTKSSSSLSLLDKVRKSVGLGSSSLDQHFLIDLHATLEESDAAIEGISDSMYERT